MLLQEVLQSRFGWVREGATQHVAVAGDAPVGVAKMESASRDYGALHCIALHHTALVAWMHACQRVEK